jgi:hypothetical protein
MQVSEHYPKQALLVHHKYGKVGEVSPCLTHEKALLVEPVLLESMVQTARRDQNPGDKSWWEGIRFFKASPEEDTGCVSSKVYPGGSGAQRAFTGRGKETH